MALSPMMTQYIAVKEKYKNAILMYRVGDFFEMFYDDAKIASRELELTLTGKDCGEESRAPMCGVPFHAVDNYIGRLVSKGYKVVICDQTEDSKQAVGLVKRNVTRIVTPGTITDTAQLDESKNNYICAIYISGNMTSLCFADITTGEVSATTVDNEGEMSKVINELSVFSPKEVIVNTDITKHTKLCDYINERLRAALTFAGDSIYDGKSAIARLNSARVSGQAAVNEFDPSYIALGAVINYIDTNLITVNFAIKSFELYGEGQYLKIDASTRRNLELCETMRERNKRGSLLYILDKTKTSPGARLLRRSLEMPLINQRAIVYRQKAVGELYNDLILRDELGECLKKGSDLERLMPKIVYNTASARDIRAIYCTLITIPEIKSLLCDAKSPALCDIREKTDSLNQLCDMISRAIVERPPFTVRDGGMIQDGFNEELDKLRRIKSGAKDILNKIENDEREKTGIKTLKIGYNRVFGYYIEISKAFKDAAPDYYIRKQTLANGERYITPELKELEETILTADEKISALEYDIFHEVCDEILRNSSQISETASALASLDFYLSLAVVAAENSYICPEVTYDDVIDIKEGRHPVVEKSVAGGFFVPNDIHIDTQNERLLIITGPNMAGKSTYMRQTALIVVMAQIGSFVPAEDARIGIVDRLFTRVGASDDLSSGQSTFMLEMTEVAYILKNATKRSLIIYDEIGRGTSTYDGMSIAKAVAEYTAGEKIGAKTLFATHYHELAALSDEIQGVVNYHISAKKRGDDIVFLRKILHGAADDSYGIEVAKLAGVPNEVTKRAKQVLALLLSGQTFTSSRDSDKQNNINMTIDNYFSDAVADKLRETNIDTLTPIEALNLVYQLKNMLK